MTISLYEGRRYDPSSFVRVTAVANVVFSALVLFAWPVIGLMLAEPISAVAGGSLDAGSTPEYADFPYVFLWLAPISSVVIAWAAQAADMSALARFVVAYPLSLVALCCLWYFCGDFVVNLG